MQNRNPSADNVSRSPFSRLISGLEGWEHALVHAAHTVVISQDTPATAVYLVESGMLKLSRVDPSGHEVIAGLRRRHWLLGVTAVLLGRQYSFNVTTLVASRLRRISADKFLDLVNTDTAFARDLLAMLSQEVFMRGEQVATLACLRAKDRLKHLLCDIINELDMIADADEEVKLVIPLKHREMAQMIAVVPEHLSRLLKSLEGEGVIKRNGNMLIVSNVSDLMVKCERRASPA